MANEIQIPAMQAAFSRALNAWRRSASARRLYGSTLFTEAAILASQLVVYRLAASYLGKAGFSEYALARRTISLLQPAAILGLSTGIPRFVAFAAARRPERQPENYLAPGLLIAAGALAVSLTALNVFKSSAAYLFFGSARYRSLIPAVAVFLLGLALEVACEGYFRGRLEMRKANVLRFVNLGLLPVAIFPLFGSSTARVLTAIGAAIGAASAGALLSTGFSFNVARLLGRTRELLAYSLGRVPGDCLQLALLALPAILTAHLEGVGPAGLVAFGISVMVLVCSLFPPISMVLLPEASQMISRGDRAGLARRVNQVLATALVTVTVSVVTLELFARPLFRLYLGRSFDDAAGIVRILILGALPYAIYLGLRSVIDAAWVAPINSRNMLVSFALFLVGCAVVYFRPLPGVYILAAFVAALYVLGALTLFEIRKICWRRSLVAAVPALERSEGASPAFGAESLP